jgi:hypothetical protein
VEQRVIAWSHGRSVRVVVLDEPRDYERLFRLVSQESRRTDDQERLADDVSAIFNAYVRLDHRETAGAEEIVLTVG